MFSIRNLFKRPQKKLEDLQPGDLFLYQEEDIGPDKFEICLQSGFSPTIISIINRIDSPRGIWGVFKKVVKTEIEDDLFPGSILSYLYYYDLTQEEERLLTYWTGFNITISILKKKHPICKDWFKINKAQKYLTHSTLYLRNFAKKYS